MKVNYLLIGAGRSGSTSFCKYLEQHSEVCFSTIKEVHYFSQKDLFNRGEQYLHAFFKPSSDVNIWATADTYLLIDYSAIERIKMYNPEMRIIVILRDPLQRAISSFKYAVNYGYQSNEMSLIEAFREEKNILEREKSIIQRNNKLHFYGGLYYKHLSEWLKVFPKEQFFITRTTDLKNEPLQVVNSFADFAGIGRADNLEAIQLNQSAASKIKWLEQFLLNRESVPRRLIRNLTPVFLKQLIIRSGSVDKLHAMNRSDKPVHSEVDLTVTDEMRDYFKEDLKKLNQEIKTGSISYNKLG